MRIGLVLLFASVLVAAACWFAFRGGRTPADAGVAPSNAESNLPDADRIEPADTQSARNPAIAPPDASGTDPVGANERLRVIGRCMDEHGLGLPGVELGLDVPGRRWSAADSAPLEKGDGPVVGRFRVVSSDDGRFRFDVPPPDASQIQFVAVAGADRQAVRRQVDVSGPGELDLGDVRFQVGGRIEGAVRSVSGAPIEGAWIVAIAAPECCSGFSDREGRYVAARLPAGRWQLEARDPRYRTVLHPAVELRPGGTVRDIDFVLEDAPVLQGRVVDRSQNPIAKATVSARPMPWGDDDETLTGEDGRFTLSLQASPRGQRRVEVFGEGWLRNRRPDPIAENTRELLIVLDSAPHMTFRVLDWETKVPIERYRIRVVRVKTGDENIDASVPESDHPGGEVTLETVPDDQLVLLHVKGRARAQVPVAPDEPGGTVQTLLAWPGSFIVGRTTIDGMPQPGVEVHVVRLPLEPPSTTTNPKPPKPKPAIADPGEVERAKRARWNTSYDWPGRDRSQKTDAEGRFRFEELSPGSWVVSVRGNLNVARAPEPAPLGYGTYVDLGDLELARGASIVGHVTVPSGIDPSYVMVFVDGPGIPAWADERGDFRVEGLDAGAHRLQISPNTLAGLDERSIDVELAQGEQKRIEIDLRENELARVRVRVTRDGLACPGILVEAEYQDAKNGYLRGSPTDAQGMCELLARPRAGLSVIARTHLVLARTPPMTFEPGQHVDVDLAIAPGRLSIEMPARIQVPAQGEINIRLNDGHRDQYRWAVAPRAVGGAQIDWTSTRLELGEIAPGDYDVVLFLVQNGKTNDSFRLQGKGRVETGRNCLLDLSNQ